MNSEIKEDNVIIFFESELTNFSFEEMKSKMLFHQKLLHWPKKNEIGTSETFEIQNEVGDKPEFPGANPKAARVAEAKQDFSLGFKLGDLNEVQTLQTISENGDVQKEVDSDKYSLLEVERLSELDQTFRANLTMNASFNGEYSQFQSLKISQVRGSTNPRLHRQFLGSGARQNGCSESAGQAGFREESLSESAEGARELAKKNQNL